jgi:hypothetical protein
MKISKIIKEINSGDYKNIHKLNGDLNDILSSLKNEIPNVQEFSVVRGNFLELPIKLACFLQHSDFEGMRLYEKGMIVNDFCQIRGGGSGGGDTDILIKDEKNKKLLAISSKIKNKIDWAQTELRTTILSMRDKFRNWEKRYGINILSKEQLENSPTQIEIIQEELHNKNIFIYDINSLSDYWIYVWSVFQNFNFDLKVLAEKNRTRSIMSLYPHQKDAVDWFVNNKEKSLLLAHKPRSGKTVTTAAIIDRMKYKNVLLLTFFPALNSQWKNTFYSYKGFENFNIYDYPSGDILDDIDFKKKNIVMLSFQGTDIEKKKLKRIFESTWDLLVIDEVHYGSETERSGDLLSKKEYEQGKKLIDGLKYNKFLGLSATPTKNLAYGTFNSDTTHIWTYLDEHEAKIGEHPLEKKYGTDTRYEQYPDINFYQYEVPESIKKEVLQELTEEEQFTFKKFLRVENGKFFYDASVKEFIKFLYGKNGKYDGSVLETINPTISLIFLPTVKIQMMFEEYLKKDSYIKEHYSVKSFNSKLYPDNSTLLQKVDDFLCSTDKEKKIVLAVGQLKLGVTLQKCDTVMFMNDTKSSDDYIQMSYRCQSPSEGKKDCYVIDFLPYRNMEIILDYAFKNTDSNNNLSAGEVIERWLKCSKIFNVTDGKFTSINVNNFLDIHSRLNKIDFRNYFLKHPMLNLSDKSERDIEELKVLLENVNKQDLTIKMKESFGDDELSGGKNTKGSRGKKERLDFKENNDYIKKLQSVLATIQWLCIFSRLRYNGIRECLNNLEREGTELYEDVVGIPKKSIFTIIDKGWMNIKNIDYSISLFNKFFREHPKEITKNMNSNKKSIKQFGDVFTPIALVNDMLDKLPSEVWSDPNKKWLDNACGTGNFLVIVYQRLMDGLKNVIPNEEERRKHILESMIYGVEIQEKYVFLTELRLDLNQEFNLHIECADSLKFNYSKWNINDSWIIIGNPPYTQNIDLKFIEKCVELKPKYILIVHPATLFVNRKEETSGQKKYFDTKKIIQNNIKQLAFINGNMIFGVFLFYPCEILFLDLTKEYKTIDVEYNLGKNNKKYTYNSVFDINKHGNIPEYLSLENKILSFCKKSNLEIHKKVGTNNKKPYLIEFAEIRGNVDKINMVSKDFYTFVPKDLGVVKKNSKHAYYEFDTKKEANNFLNFLKTDFARFSLSIYKYKSHLSGTGGELKSVPYLNYNEEWTDKKLYKYFKLTKKEIKFIESVIPKYY